MHIIDLKIDYHDSPRGLSTISCIYKKKIILSIIICKFLNFLLHKMKESNALEMYADDIPEREKDWITRKSPLPRHHLDPKSASPPLLLVRTCCKKP